MPGLIHHQENESIEWHNSAWEIVREGAYTGERFAHWQNVPARFREGEAALTPRQVRARNRETGGA